MSDELDPGLKRLFAETAEAPADEAFVAAVTVRTARVRRPSPVVRQLAAGCVTALALGAAVGGVGLALQQGAQVIMPLINSSPIGIVTGLSLALAGAICVRLLAPFAVRRP
jgi:hypothetical protein